MRTWLGLDIGTSSVKALVIDDAGSVVCRGSADYPSYCEADRHEQDADDYVRAARTAIASCHLDELAGIGIVGQTPSLVLARADGSASRPVLTWRDSRAQAEAALLRSQLGPSEDLAGVANLWEPSHLPAKLLWLARHEPASLHAASWLLTPKDYLAFRFTGVASTDAWSVKGLWSIRNDRAARELFQLLGVPETLMPEVKQPWARLGSTSHSAAADLGLPQGLPVAVGWTDALGGMLGIGAATTQMSFILTGTSDIVGSSVAGDGVVAHGLYLVPRPHSPLTVVYGPTQSSGASLVWLARLMGTNVEELVGRSAGARDTRAMFVPYLRGERAPVWSASVRASFTGLAEDDDVAELALAVMRGVALSDRHVLESSWAHKVALRVHIGGSSVFEDGWIRARTDVLEQDLVLHREPQLPALGAAMLARSAATGAPIQDSQKALRDDVVVIPADVEKRPRARDLRRSYMLAAQAALGLS